MSLNRTMAQKTRERVAFETAPNGILVIDMIGQILMANHAMEMLTGYGAGELVDQNSTIFVHAHLRVRVAKLMRHYLASLALGATSAIASKLIRRNGQMLEVEISVCRWDNDSDCYAVAYVRDLTVSNARARALKHQSTHDQLTGLPNRLSFQRRLDRSLDQSMAGNTNLAVLFVGMDRFKAVNESFGHAIGDALLLKVALRIRSLLRERDCLARLGGDEFGILLSSPVDPGLAVSVANMILTELQHPYRLRDQDVYSGGSLGIAFYPENAKDSDTLLRYADIALNQAKQNGRGVHACYVVGMDRRMHQDMELHSRLKEALLHGRLELHYQPQVSVKNGDIVGAEALLRWHDPVLGDVSPSQFIPVAEATGLILPLSDWVLETACAQIALWIQAGTPLRVAINISAIQFRQRDLPSKVSAALKRAGAIPQLLEIEITESVAMTHPEYAFEQLSALVALGCGVALDDFGTGHSSLAYLKNLPVSKIKIDKSFMDGIPGNVGGATVSCAIIALTHSLGMTIVAEGVETQEQLSFLRAHDCEAYQGWLFCKAKSAIDLTRQLLERIEAVSANRCQLS